MNDGLNREDQSNSRVDESDSESAAPRRRQSTSDRTRTVWGSIVPEHIHNIFLPQHPRHQLLPGEEIQLEIHLAWYRDVTAILLYRFAPTLFVVTILLSLMFGYFSSTFSLDFISAMRLPFILLIAFVLYALFQHFQYSQWRLIKTNARLIISMPQRDAWYLVDNIEMNSLPNVIDANWSDNNFTRLLQAITGARDLYISLVGLQFKEGSAVVKDALVIPDVDDEDIRRLKQLVFAAK